MNEERTSVERMQMMFDATPMIIMYWNKSYECIDCNPAAADFYGIASRESKEELCSFFYAAGPMLQPEGIPTRDYWRYHLDRAFEDGEIQFDFATKKGPNNEDKTVHFGIIARRMNFMDNDVVITYANDVTASKSILDENERASNAEAGSQAKSRFLARMSHEIRTPITAVLGTSEIFLQRTDLDLDVRDAFTRIYNSSSSLLGIVNDILDLSKIEAGQMDLLNTEYEPASLLSDVIQMQTIFAGKKQLSFNVEIHENIPRLLMGDQLRIRQVLVNVLSNAFKYTEIGSIKFSVKCEQESRENYVNLIILVQDTGKGMSAEQLDTLFDEYSRFHELEGRFVEGTGLGMPIVYSMLHMMDATIDVESKVNTGTTVTLNIPQEVRSSDVIGKKVAGSLSKFKLKRSERATVNAEPMPYGKVLVVDDVETNRFVAKGLLSLYQINVETCNSGHEAIEKVKAGNVYDIIFMDHMMPELNGVATTHMIRGMGYFNPIVALTANALVGKAEEFLSNGFDGFVAKPIQPQLLDDVLQEFIKRGRPSIATEPMEMPEPDPDDYYSRPEVILAMREDFEKNHKNSMKDIREALENGDPEAAKVIAHTIKSLASYMKEKDLFAAAYAVEMALEIERKASMGMLLALEREFNKVLDSI